MTGKKLKIGKRTGLRYFGIEEIRGWGPCYPPEEKLPAGWRGTAIDILALEHVSVPDRLWVVLRSEIVSERVMRLFAVWCVRQVQHLMTDPRSIVALDVAERFANGKASKEERDAARAAAGDAARAAARDAARAAAWAAAGDAARAAARAAARDAARAAAGDAAGAAAWAAAWAAQFNKLREMILAEGKERHERLKTR